MPKKVIEDVNPTYGSWSESVKRINQTYTYVADISDVNQVKRDLTNKIDSEIKSIDQRLRQLESIRDIIRNFNEEQVSLLRKEYMTICNGIKDYEIKFDKSLQKSDASISILEKLTKDSEDLSVTKILSNHTNILSALKRQIFRISFSLFFCLSLSIVAIFLSLFIH